MLRRADNEQCYSGWGCGRVGAGAGRAWVGACKVWRRLRQQQWQHQDCHARSRANRHQRD